MSDLLIRFVIGGVVVSLFAVIGDVLKPKDVRGSFWSRAFGCAGHPGAHQLLQRQSLCVHRGAIDGGRCFSFHSLQLSRGSDHDAVQTIGSLDDAFLTSGLGVSGDWLLACAAWVRNMVVYLNMSALRQTKWYQYAIRFALGGLVTATAGLIAKKYGPSFGGLFLAFPAIFPASATLIEKHERERKQHKGKSGVQRARNAVAADAIGAAIGSVGLICFGFYAWKMLPQHGVWSTLLCATVIWLATSVLIWYLRKRHVLRHPLKTIPLISPRGSRPPELHPDATYKGSKAMARKRNYRA